jgi:protoporphyrinogen/coproporphyrinogen III oxidase
MIAIAGGGISGLAMAYQLACEGVEFTLFEASARLGGIVKTVHRQGFVIECGPDSWVTEKPWARDLAVELGLEDQIIASNDRWRRTYVQRGNERYPQLIPIPDGMRMMVPGKWSPLLESPLFSWQARLAYLREPKRAEELKATAPVHDESVADFVRRHFGEEVTATIAGPLLAAVFGGDIAQLSVRAVMPGFVRMEAEQGSLVQAVQHRAQTSTPAIFTTLASGLETLVDRMVAKLPKTSVRLSQPILRMCADHGGWRVTTASGSGHFDAVVLATPPHVTNTLLQPLSDLGARMASLLPQRASSAIVVALAFTAEQATRLRIPRGFGFVVPPVSSGSEEYPLLACTFVDQKFPDRVPANGVLLRAFFGGSSADALLGEVDDQLIERARLQLGRVLGPLPQTAETLVCRWPQSLPQYTVGHLDRMAELESMLSTVPGLHLLGSAYFGVGLPDLIREGRAAARSIANGLTFAGAKRTPAISDPLESVDVAQ